MPNHRQTLRYSPVALWHLLSVDAPTVATLWAWFVARSVGLSLPLLSLASMFTAVWMLYAADRLLDARIGDSTRASHPQLEERHRFHHRHRQAFLVGIVIAAILLAAMLPTLLPEALRLYALLASLLFGWFLLIHTRLTADRRLPKELAVGLFFPAAVFVPTVARTPGLRLTLIFPALLFAAVCTLNCLYLYAWEHPADRSQAHWTTRFAARHLSTLAALIATVSLLCSEVLKHVASSMRLIWYLPAACTISTLFLLLLNYQRHRLSALHLRAAADLALLTPLLFAPFLTAAPR